MSDRPLPIRITSALHPQGRLYTFAAIKDLDEKQLRQLSDLRHVDRGARLLNTRRITRPIARAAAFHAYGVAVKTLLPDLEMTVLRRLSIEARSQIIGIAVEHVKADGLPVARDTTGHDEGVEHGR